MPAVTQEWTHSLPFMQQTVLLLALRGPDGTPKYDPPKMLLRFYRRCILISSLDNVILTDPSDKRGGSFTGPSLAFHVHGNEWPREMNEGPVAEYIRQLDAAPHHFHTKLMHGCEILGYKHPDLIIRNFWHGVYKRFADEMHLLMETEEMMDKRLGDNRNDWLARADEATAT